MTATGLLKQVCSWMIWNHQNRYIFEKESLSLVRALVMDGEKRKLWALAGARGLNLLAAPLLGS
jgi:hypothetical protein